MSDPLSITVELHGGEPTIWVAECPFRKTGSPVLGSAGSSIRPVVVMEMATWKRLCAENVGLQTTAFRVGTL